MLQQSGVDLNGGADDEGVGVGEFVGEGALDLVGGDDLPAGFGLEDGKGGGRDFFSENDLHGCLDGICCPMRWLSRDACPPLLLLSKIFRAGRLDLGSQGHLQAREEPRFLGKSRGF